jgi:glutamate racemase
MNLENTLRFAFYDSGIGGFSVLREFLKFFKDTNKLAQVNQTVKPELKIEIHYIADSARAPYGARSLDDIKRYVYEFSNFAANLGIDYFISACNTSSNLFEDLDFSQYEFKTLNLFTALNSFLEKEKETLALANLYYLATQANIASGKYKNLALKVHPIACPKLVPLIEKFNFNEAISVLETEYLKKDNEKNAEAGAWQHSPQDILILGCTHYALLKHLLTKYSVIDPAELILKEFSRDFLASKISLINLNTYSTGENSSLIVSTKELTVSSET